MHARLKLEKEFSVTEEDFKTIDKEIKKIITEAAEFAQTSSEPNPSELYTDILIENERNSTSD